MFGWIYLIVVTIFGMFAIVFAISNQGEVMVRLPGEVMLTHVPLFVLVFVPLMLGFLLGAFSGWTGGLKYRQRVERLRDQKLALEQELTNLRNLPLANDF
ncbi:MAG: LapA family protein [Magnetococcus sp. YQC-5]